MKLHALVVMVFLMLALLQMSFLSGLTLLPQAPNLILIAFFILLVTVSEETIHPFFFIFVAGIFLDFFSPTFFGFSVIVLLSLYWAKNIFNYFIGGLHVQNSLVYFFIVFTLGYLSYEAIVATLVERKIVWHLPWMVITFQITVAVLSYYLYQKISRWLYRDRQLRLEL